MERSWNGREDECTNVKARGLEPGAEYIYIRTGGKIEISVEHDESIGVVDERDQSTMKRERRDATFQKISTTPVPRLSSRVAFYQDILHEEVERERESKRQEEGRLAEILETNGSEIKPGEYNYLGLAKGEKVPPFPSCL